MTEFIKIQGLERSGTNFIKYLLDKNYYCRCLSNLFYGKHNKAIEDISAIKRYDYRQGSDVSGSVGVVTDITHDEFIDAKRRLMTATLKHVIIFKNIKSWGVSHQRVVNWPKNIEAEMENYYDDFYLFWLHYFETQQPHCFLVYYNDFIKNKERVMEAIGQKFQLVRRNNDLILQVHKKMHMGTDMIGDINLLTSAFDETEYLQDTYQNVNLNLESSVEGDLIKRYFQQFD